VKFSTIMADPPWPYATPGKGPLGSSPTHRPKSWENELAGSNMRSRYQPMALDEIKALGVNGFASDNAHLYLWTTNGFLVEAHDVARAWGFRPITCITWVKVKKGDPTQPSMKAGYYFRGATEHVIFAVRGSLDIQTKRGVSTAFMHPRTPHSVKPDAFYTLIEECSPGPYLELFSRRERAGWTVWGNEVECGISLGKVG
jgi:N6-adenosine-specific RNA methylase IME4